MYKRQGVNDADDVVIFQGLQGSVLGVSLRWQVEDSCPEGSAPDCQPIGINDLQEARRSDVRSGITDVDGLDSARDAMRRLRMTALLPQCEEPDPTPPVHTPSTPPDAPAPPGQTSEPGEPPAPGAPPSPTDTPLASAEQTPGVTCRTVS